MNEATIALVVFAGGIMAFMGYRIFSDVLSLWGFLIAGGFGAYLSTLFVRPPGGAFQVTVPLAVGFAVGGLVGLLLARYIKGVIVFLTGGMLGILVGTQGMSLIGQRPDTLLAAGLAVAFGLAAIRFEEIVLIISTSFVGAAAIMYGVTQLVTINPILAAVAFFLAGFFGAAAQYKDAQNA
jgi:hypothetical protein